MLFSRLIVIRLASCCKAYLLDMAFLAGCQFWLVGYSAVIWLPNLCLAVNPVTRIPDFVQPCWLFGGSNDCFTVRGFMNYQACVNNKLFYCFDNWDLR
jgi:hypothetical protein